MNDPTYPPKHYVSHEYQHAVETMRRFPLATLISADGENCFPTHLPLVYHAEGNTEFGKLVGHIDKYNPHCKFLDNRKIYAIFHGPNAYISPLTYATKQLPTWNYVKIHVVGTARLTTDPEAIKQSIIGLTAQMEQSKVGLGWQLSPTDPRLDALLPYVVGFEMDIESWEGKTKLSTDKLFKDIARAKEKLLHDSQADLRDFMDIILPEK